MIDPKRTVAEVAQTAIYTITPDTGIASALRMAVADRVSHLLVLNQGVLAGIVSRSDLVRGRAFRGALADHVMTAPVLCVVPDTTVGEALQIMEEQRVSYLPVLAGGFLVGCVTRELLAGPRPANDNDHPLVLAEPN